MAVLWVLFVLVVIVLDFVGLCCLELVRLVCWLRAVCCALLVAFFCVNCFAISVTVFGGYLLVVYLCC